jgi:hypothetical protein
MTQRVEFEIISARLGFLEGRFRVGDKEIICAIHWNGEDIEQALKRAAEMAVYTARLPPRPTQEMLDAQIGKIGSVDVEDE